METCTSLYKPFLLGIFQDICELYPVEITSDEITGCTNIISALKQKDVIQLCKIGKWIEKCFITGEKLPLKHFETEFSSEQLSELFFDEDGYPRLLNNCFKRLFRKDGTLTFGDEALLSLNRSFATHGMIETEFYGTNFQKIEWAQSLVGTRVADSYALAMLCLRQFYLGCSKLRDWECLRRRNFGDTDFRYAGYTALQCISDAVLSSTHRTEAARRVIISFAKSFDVAVC